VRRRGGAAARRHGGTAARRRDVTARARFSEYLSALVLSSWPWKQKKKEEEQLPYVDNNTEEFCFCVYKMPLRVVCPSSWFEIGFWGSLDVHIFAAALINVGFVVVLIVWGRLRAPFWRPSG